MCATVTVIGCGVVNFRSRLFSAICGFVAICIRPGNHTPNFLGLVCWFLFALFCIALGVLLLSGFY